MLLLDYVFLIEWYIFANIINALFESRIQVGLEHCPLMLAWHGCSHEAALGICTHGAADIRITDGGFFGTGCECQLCMRVCVYGCVHAYVYLCMCILCMHQPCSALYVCTLVGFRYEVSNSYWKSPAPPTCVHTRPYSPVHTKGLLDTARAIRLRSVQHCSVGKLVC